MYSVCVYVYVHVCFVHAKTDLVICHAKYCSRLMKVRELS